MDVVNNTTRGSIVQPPAPPPLFNATAESLLSDTKRYIERAKAVQDAVVASVTPETAAFTNTILPLVQDENIMLYERQLIEFYQHVSTDENVRKASENAEQLFSEFDTETALRNDLYILLAAVRDRDEDLSPESHRLLETLLLGFEQNGLALSEEGRTRLRELNNDLIMIRREYIESCRDCECELWFTEDELEGVSENVLSTLEHGSGAHQGKLRVTYSVIRDAKRQETRRKVYVDSAQSFKANVPLLEKATRLREEKARLLNYSSFAEFRMAENMEKSPQKIQAFLEDILAHITPARDALVIQWRKMKQDDLKARGEHDDGKFYAWDRAYYAEQLRAQKHAFDTDILRDYFPLDETIKRMLNIFEKVMGMTFVEIFKEEHNALPQGVDSNAIVWHEDVQLFAVWDDSDGSAKKTDFLGYLYMDMHPGPGKRAGFSDQPVRPAFTDVGGDRKYTSTALICNFEKPTKAKPCLLNHSDVVLLFHELGHGIHDLVAKTEYGRFHGASTAADFNEAPSQMLEEWCWCPLPLRMLSCHYSNLSPEYLDTWRREKELGTTQGDTNPAALPEDLIEKLLLSRHARNTFLCLVLLERSLFDQAITDLGSREDAAALDTTRLAHSIAHKVWGYDTPDDLPPVQASELSHFTTSGMYMYLICQVYSLDMFYSAFKSDPMNKEQGLRYRRTVIGKGSSENEMKIMTDFLGRPPNLHAFYQEYRLI